MLWEKIDLAREEGCLEIPQNRISSLLTPKSKAQPLKKRSCGLGGSQVDRTQSFTWILSCPAFSGTCKLDPATSDRPHNATWTIIVLDMNIWLGQRWYYTVFFSNSSLERLYIYLFNDNIIHRIEGFLEVVKKKLKNTSTKLYGFLCTK